MNHILSHSHETISIAKVANGYVVTVPVEVKFEGDYGINEHQLRYQARVMKDEMLGDDLLKAAQPVAEIKTDVEMKPKQLDSHPGVYTFTTFTEVLGFLKYFFEIVDEKELMEGKAFK